MKVIKLAMRSTKIRLITICGPIGTNNCPITQGRIMPPTPAPSRNQPVIEPVMCIFSSAIVNIVGKIEAILRPNRIVPIQSAVAESAPRMIIPILTRHPAKSMYRIFLDSKRVDMGIPAIRPRVKKPQNADVK